MKKVYILVSLLFLTLKLFSQYYTICGTIRDSVSGESLYGANISISETKQGVVSNSYGFYSLSLATGSYNLTYSYLGYIEENIQVQLTGNIHVDVFLKTKQTELQEVVISGKKSNIEQSSVSRNTITAARIKSIPSLGGEADVLKSLQLMPGIQAATEGSTNLYIRGGSYDQNLILLDEAPVYNPAHALGFFSTFNSDAIKDVSVMKGVFPAQYGGRLSSVVDITMREGNNKKTEVSAGVGLLASRFTIEGPILKNKLSYLVSGRYSYSGSTYNFLGGNIGRDLLHEWSLRNFNDKNKIWFYDLNTKFNFIINQRNHIYFSYYSGHDSFYSYMISNQNILDWGNFTSTIRWNHIFNNKLFSNFTLYNSKYNYSYSINEDIRNFNWNSDIKETGIKSDFTYFLNQSNNIKSGISVIFHNFNPGSISPHDSTSIIQPFKLDEKRSLELCGYLSNNQKISQRFSIDYGIRYHLFMNLGYGLVYKYDQNMKTVIDSSVFAKNEVIDTYGGFEPRLSITLKTSEQNSFKLGYALTRQYLHLMSNSSVGLPTDTWLPPDSYIKPQSSQQFVLGFCHSSRDDKFELSLETYYKTLKNIVDYKDNADLFINKHIETQLLYGRGYSYGFEGMLEKKTGKLSGWISYTLAKTQYQINGVNSNKYYSPRYDIRHNISITGAYHLNKKLKISSTFKFVSGGFITVPDQIFTVDGVTFLTYSGRNNYKLPNYHRLDLSVFYSSKKNDVRKWKSEWEFSVINVYNRKNIYSLFVETEGLPSTPIKAYKMYLFGLTPMISYKIKI